MKTLFLAAAVAFSFGLAPAFAGEGNGEPFPTVAEGFTARTASAPQQFADTGSSAYPDVAGRPGSDLPGLAGDVLPTNGSEGAVQTANSLPARFEEGTVAYAQANRVHNWMVAHAQRSAAFASAARRIPGG